MNNLNIDNASFKRLERLKEKLITIKPSVCTERAEVYTEIYKKNEFKPLVIKRAMALSETLKRMTIFIDEDDLVVGNQASKLRAAPIFPEYAMSWIIDEIDEFDKRPGDAFFLSKNDKQTIKELNYYWEGKTLHDKGEEFISNDLKQIQTTGFINAEENLISGDGHISINHSKLLKFGISGYIEYVKEKQSQLNLEIANNIKINFFYEAIIIALEGVIKYIRRYANLADSLFKQSNDEFRKEELHQIENICNNLAVKPPQTFHEAIQLITFVQMAIQIESNGNSISLGRFDQYLYSFYINDLESGKSDDQLISYLLSNFWCKLYSVNKIRPWSYTKFAAGSPLYQNVTIGGQTPDAGDAVNKLSFLILKTVGEMKLTQPNLSVRYHKDISRSFLKECINVIGQGFGMPAFNNDEIVIPSLIKLGVEQKDAYNYSAIGCTEIAVPGKWGYRCTGMTFLNFMKVFMAAINNGKDLISGKTFCVGNGTLSDFNSFDDVMNSWKHQIEFYAKATVRMDSAVDLAIEENVPDILSSTFIDHCIDRGKTLKEGGSKYDFISGPQVGIANLGNSLAAIKKLVFEDKKITKESLMTVLSNNYEGLKGEVIRQTILNYAPKYGNDDDYVDKLTAEAYSYFIDEIEKHHTSRYRRGPIGCRYYAGASTIAANVPCGAVVPATPDGRKAFTPLAEGCSPSAGTDVHGPTSVFKSVSVLPAEKILGGVLLNQKMSPLTFKDDINKEKILSMIDTFFSDLKGWHVQYNIVDRKTLLEAQKNPEEYKSLVVRVAGYSAFFTTLSPDTQNDIISRTEQTI